MTWIQNLQAFPAFVKAKIKASKLTRIVKTVRSRYGIEILNYSVTSNHIHLLVYGNEDREVIPRSLQLVAGRTAQAYNKNDSGKGLDRSIGSWPSSVR